MRAMQAIRRTVVRVINSRVEPFINISRKSLSTTPSKIPEITITKSTAKSAEAISDPKISKESCGTMTPDDELEELEEMYIMGPAGIEWGGPTRGGARPEPTRYKDWERKGRCTDF